MKELFVLGRLVLCHKGSWSSVAHSLTEEDDLEQFPNFLGDSVPEGVLGVDDNRDLGGCDVEEINVEGGVE